MHQLDLLGLDVNSSYRNKGLKLHGYGGSVTAPWPSSYPTTVGTALPRHEFDNLLFEAARTAGATVWTGTPATAPELAGNRMTSFRVGEQTVRAKWVIVADGVRSTFGKLLGRKWHQDEVYGIAARSYATSTSAGEPWMHSHVELKDQDGSVQPGYGWIFPLGEELGQVNIGLGALSTAQRPARINTKKLLPTTPRASAPTGAWATSRRWPLPCFRWVARCPTWLSQLDAHWRRRRLRQSLNGEGIDYGLETAQLAVSCWAPRTSRWRGRIFASPLRRGLRPGAHTRRGF